MAVKTHFSILLSYSKNTIYLIVLVLYLLGKKIFVKLFFYLDEAVKNALPRNMYEGTRK